MATTNHSSSFISSRFSLALARSCHPKRRKSSRGHAGAEGHPQRGRQPGGAGRGAGWGVTPLGAAGLAQAPPRPAARAWGIGPAERGPLPGCPRGTGRRGARHCASWASPPCCGLQVPRFLLQSSARGFPASLTLAFPCNFWHKREQLCR